MSAISFPNPSNDSTAAPRTGSSTTPELDVAKLQALSTEQQDIYLLNFLSTLTDHVVHLAADDCTSQQFYLKKELFQILNLATSVPTRVVRSNLGQCFAHIFGEGDRKLLFETIGELVNIISTGKGKAEGELRHKHAAVHCLGEVYAAAGDSAIGLHPLVCSSLMKLFKVASSNAGLRAAIFKALDKIIKMIKGSADETIARDIWKQARSYASSEKSCLVQICASKCLGSLTMYTGYFDNAYDFENLKSTVWKTMDSATPAVRHAAAACLAEALIKIFSEHGTQDGDIPKLRKPKKPNTKNKLGIGVDEGEERPENPGLSPGPKKSHAISLTLEEVLRQISTQYIRTSANNKVRAGLAVCYSKIMRGLREKVVETNYIKIADHLMIDLLSHNNVVNNRYRLLITRRFVQVILEDIIGREILGEAGQLNAARALVNNILKNYPQVVKERAEPTKYALIATLSTLTSLIKTLGSASNIFADACRDGLLQVIQHPSYTVQVYASRCLRAFTFACPQQLLPCLTICMNSVNRELNLLTTARNSPRRCVGYANGLSAMISTSSLQPLYGSVDVNSRVLSLATGLLKSSGKSELRISSTQIQVAWILIGGLMSLGPNFVKIHLSQLLLLWKNALPKPLAKDNTAQRSYLESSFLTHVRECALGSILAFLQSNSRLLTIDVSKRIAAMLQNTSTFLKGLPSKKTTDDVSQRLSPSLQLLDFDVMVQRRVLQCYTKLVNLSPTGGSEALLQSNLLTLAVSFFAEPDSYTPSSLSTSIANSAATFESIWDVGDNCGFGVTGLIRGFNIKQLPGEHIKDAQREWMIDQGPEFTIDGTLLSPVCSSLEHDSLTLYVDSVDDSGSFPDPPATEVVNTAIKLFAIAFPLTASKIQESILEQIATFLAAGSLQRDPGRKSAMQINVATAFLSTLKVAVKETQSLSGDLTNSAVEKLMQEMIRGFVTQQDQYLRNIGYESLGRLCNSSGNSYTNQEIKWLVDTIVSNREPSARAGCAMALGCIHSQVGGMAAGFHLKTILGILMSLCNDPHPTVHFWALNGLARVTDSAGLTFTGYISNTLGMLGQLYVADTHNEEVASQVNSNLEIELPTTVVIARCVDSLINVLGPDLQDMSKTRDLILMLVGQFREEESALVLGVSLRCLEHLSVYAPGYVNFADYVVLLQQYLKSNNLELRNIAIDGLYNLMKRNSEDVIKVAKEGFEDQLWLALDFAPTHEGIRNVIRNWLRQSSLTDTVRWLQRCQKVLTMTKPRPAETPSLSAMAKAVPDLQDEEVAGFAAAAGTTTHDAQNPTGHGQEPLRWQVRTFAMSCLSEIFNLVSKEISSSDGATPAELALQQKVADIIRMAFSASTSNIVELRIWGLKIIDLVLKMFGKTPDPDFAEAPLLEQYQAQISSALTPAFAADSSPELAAEAVNVCAGFIATGIVTDVDRMGRILKTLVNALENFSKETENAAIGDLKGLSSNAQVMVKMAVFSAWAELQVASSEQKYLIDVMKPYVAILTPLWLSSLREFARLRFEPEISMSLGPPSLSGSLDSIYSALNRETLLRFYQDSWLKLVDAIASLIGQDSDFVFDALDGKEAEMTKANGKTTGFSKGNDINYRDEPVAFFFVLFGIAFEALVARPGNDSLATKEQTLEILHALKKILHPSVSGHAIYREAIFSETMDLLDRLVLTEGLDVQGVIVHIARGLCISHPSATKKAETENGDLSDDVEQLFELTRIIVLVLAGIMPNLTDAKQPVRSPLTDDAVHLILLSLNALVDAAEVFPSIIKTDLHACIIHIFATILGTAACQVVVVPQSLPILKRFITSISELCKEAPSDMQLRGCLKRFLSIYLNAQKRETETSLPCVKNSLLASTLLLTSGTNFMSASEPLVARFLDETVDCLSDRMTAKVAANCIRSLLLQSPKTPADQSIAKYLVSRLISFITNTGNEDPENARGLIAHALTSFVTSLKETQLSVAISLIVPSLLSRASSEKNPAAVYQETSVRLLELAGAGQAAFRGVVTGMTDGQKAFMEGVIMSGRGSSVTEQKLAREGSEPTIALRMNFGAA